MNLKDHIIRDVVTNLRDVAIEFHAAGQLRERLRHALEPLLTQQVDRIAPAPDDAPQVVADERAAFEVYLDSKNKHGLTNRDTVDAEYLAFMWKGWSERGALAAAPVQAQEHRPELTVWYGPMPESNGKSNFTATLKRKDARPFDTNSYTFERSEYPERVRYEADCMRYLIGEIDTKPDILAYDADKHSGYVAPVQPVAVPDGEEFGFKALRLRRTAFLLGLEGAIPYNDKDLMDCMGAVLGMICREVERIAAPAAQGDAKDADRYRWLRDGSLNQWQHPLVVSQERYGDHMHYLGPLTGSSLDSSVDAAIAASKVGA